MSTIKAHKHLWDVHPTQSTRVVCTVCGFSVPARMLKSKVNLDAITARTNATAAALARVDQSEEN